MTRKAIGLAAALVLGALLTVALAQSRRPAAPALPPTPLQLATRALIEGQYGQVASLASAQPSDPALGALRGRADIARGRYAEAEALLRPIAERLPTSDAALVLGQLLQLLGRPEAPPMLQRIADAASTATRPADLARSAMALRELGRFNEANAAYRDAATAAPRDPDIQTEWGEMFLAGRCQTCNADAMKSFQAALRDDPRWVPALVGMARAMSSEDPPQAVAVATKALEINPSSVPAHLFIAAESADAGRRDEARASIQKALDVNPSSLEALSLLAAVAYVEDEPQEFESSISRALAISPKYGEAYRVVGEFAAHNYRFDEAVVLVRKGLAIAPGDPRMLSDLGTHLLRTGDEAGARVVLEQSFREHPYDVVTYNLLQMMDTLDTFVTVRDGDLVMRLHKDEAPVLQEPAMSLAKEALSTLSKRYQFTPKGPVLVEIFPKHDDFAVRSVGLPGMIGALGACFGRVVTIDSPRARPPGEFQWEATLWHELAHVITLQMSNQRVPRWLTEGISEYEEKIARPEWARGMDVTFARLLNRGETLKLETLNSAFQDPRSIGLAYFQASLLVEHIVDTYGDDALNDLLLAYAEGLETGEAMKKAIGTDLAGMQQAFDARMEKKYGAMRAALKEPPEDVRLPQMSFDELKAYAAENEGSYLAQMALGVTARRNGDLDTALAAFQKAATLVPIVTGDEGAHGQLAEVAMQRGDRPVAIQALKDLVGTDFNNVAAARQLAQLLKEAGVEDPAQLEPVYARIVAIDPFDAAAHAALGRTLMQRNRPADAVEEFKAVVALNPVDRASAHTDLAESYFASGKRSDARKQTLAALEIAPSYERAQDLLLKLSEANP
ncbi:MAG: tetratricopeptide repeat protein [Vicinamibacterales bacterium]